MRYGTACSGVESPSLAWDLLGWEPVFFSEIEEFPCELLRTRHPAVPNLGDMTAPDLVERINALGGLDVFCAGTPCQAFSLAGLRGSLSDARGNLCLRFVQLVHGIRSDENQGVRYAVWENVVGVLSTPDNAFGNMLAGLVGYDQPLTPGDRADPACKRFWKLDKKSGQWRCTWPRAGVVVGPRRTAVWRVLDAQGFVPQRRERVFLVSCRTQDGVNPAAVLLEPEADPAAYLAGEGGPSLFPVAQGLPWHPEAGRAEEPGSPAAAPAVAGAGGGEGAAGDLIPRGAFRMVAFGEYADDNLASTMKARDFKDATDLVVAQKAVNVRYGSLGDVTHPVQAHGGDEAGYSLHSLPCALVPDPQSPALGFNCKQDGHDAGEVSPTMLAMPHDSSHANGGGQLAVAYGVRLANTSSNGWGVQENVTHSLDTAGPPAVAVPLAMCERTRDGVKQLEFQENLSYALTNPGDGGRADSRMVLAPNEVRPPFTFQTRIARCDRGLPSNVCPTLTGADAGDTADGRPCVVQPEGVEMVVRRLTPVECERLMGFPDDYTLVPFAGKAQCSDNHRYKACGNSMVSYVMFWIGQRLDTFAKIVSGVWA